MSSTNKKFQLYRKLYPSTNIDELVLQENNHVKSWYSVRKYKSKSFTYRPLRLCIEHPTRRNQMLHKFVALDPGLLAFQTTYGSDGIVTQWGVQNGANYLNDAIIEQKSIHYGDCLRGIHNRLVNWLCTNYEVVVLPNYSTQTVWDHQRFLKKLQEQALKRHVLVTVVNEESTTITCSSCGRKNKTNLRRHKIFLCRYADCQLRAQQDINAAKNILFKYFATIMD